MARFKARKHHRRRKVAAVGAHHHRRRRVGAMSMSVSSPIMKYGPIALGFLLADKINAPIDKMVGTKLDTKIIAGAQVGLGAAYIFLKKGKKSLPLTIAAGILLGAGAKRAMTAFGIAGIGPYGRVPVVGGAYGRVPVVSGRHRIGDYNPHGSLGSYTSNQALNGSSVRSVMGGTGAGEGEGSGITNSSGGNMMG